MNIRKPSDYSSLYSALDVLMGSDLAEMERLQKIMAVLQLSQDATRYLMAEFQLQKMLADIYKILGEAVDIDMDMLRG